MADEKLTIAGVLHRLIDAVAQHPDTTQNLHQLVDDNLATDQERAAAVKGPWADAPDADVVDAALNGDQAAVAEYRARKQRALATPAIDQPPAAGG